MHMMMATSTTTRSLGGMLFVCDIASNRLRKPSHASVLDFPATWKKRGKTKTWIAAHSLSRFWCLAFFIKNYGLHGIQQGNNQLGLNVASVLGYIKITRNICYIQISVLFQFLSFYPLSSETGQTVQKRLVVSVHTAHVEPYSHNY